MIDLAIQLVNYQTKSYLAELLPQILKDLEKAQFSWVINILDNYSGDDLSDLEDEYKKSGKVNFYQSPKNLGFGAGHNLLAKRAEAKYLLILNTDLEYLEEKTIQRLLEDIDSAEEIKVVGPSLINKNGNIQWWDHSDRMVALPCGKRHKEIKQVAWVSGAVFLVEKKIFDELGGFDEGFFLYAEELDLCYRIAQKKGLIMYDSNISVRHYGGVVARRSKYIKDSNRYFLDKHFKNSPFYFPLKTLNFLFGHLA